MCLKFYISVFSIIPLFFSSSVLYGQCPTIPIEEAIVNGDFELGSNGQPYGDHVDFQNVLDNPSLYGNRTWSLAGEYLVADSSEKFNSSFTNIRDPKNPKGKFLMLDAAAPTGGKTYSVTWEQTVTIYPGQEYYFSAYLTSLTNGDKAQLAFEVKGNNDAVATVLGGAQFTAPDKGTWTQFYQKWMSGTNTSATIRLLNYQTNTGNGNDFAIDEISFINGCQSTAASGPVPDLGESKSLCTDGDITVSSLTNISSATNIYWKKIVGTVGTDLPAETGKTSILATTPGRYQVCVDYNNCIRSSIVDITNSIDADLGPNKDVCEETSTLLDANVSGTKLTYAWKKGSGVVGGNTKTYSVPAGQAATYSVTVSSSHASCGTSSKTASIILTPKNCYFVSAASSPATPCIGEDVVLKATTNGYIEKWEDAANVNKGSEASIEIIPVTASSTYKVTARFPADTLNLNGDFALGNKNFTSEFTYQTNSQIDNGNYKIVKGNESFLATTGYLASLKDVDNQNANMLAIYSTKDQSSKVIYEQTTTVVNGTKYGFSFNLKNAIADLTKSAPVELELWINNTKVLDIYNPLDNNWNYYSYLWAANSTSAKIQIKGKAYSTDNVYRKIVLDNVFLSNIGTSEFANITVNASDCRTLVARADTTACLGIPVKLSAVTNGFVNKWTPSATLEDPNSASPLATPLTQTVYTVEAKYPIQKLVTNANFSKGNTGFTSGLNLSNPNQEPGTNGDYIIGYGNESFLNNITKAPDHTTGTGLYFIGRVSTQNGAKSAYKNTVSVVSGKSYGISIWVKNLGTDFTNNNPSFDLSIAGTTVKTVVLDKNNSWQNISYSWTASSSSSINIDLIVNKLSSNGNDIKFGLDDILIAELGNPKTATTTISTKDCNQIVPVPMPDSVCMGAATVLKATTNGYITLWETEDGVPLSTKATASVYPSSIGSVNYKVTSKFPLGKIFTNPAFDNGNTGFTSSLTVASANQNPGSNQYAIVKGNESFLNHPYFKTPDHTTGTGSYMLGQLTTDQDRVILSQTTTANAGDDIAVSFYAANLHIQSTESWITFDTKISLRINGTVVATLMPARDHSWSNLQLTYPVTTTGPLTIELVSLKETTSNSPVFGLDDVKIEKVGSPKTAMLTLKVKDCFTISTQTDNVCVGDSVKIDATTNGLFKEWKIVEGGGKIIQATSPSTWVKLSKNSKIEATATFQLGNTLFNGDFEEGNVGFTSKYNYVPYTGNSMGQGDYTIGSNPNTYNGLFTKIKDHTTGTSTGKMFISDGATIVDQVIYSIKVKVVPNKKYAFSVWAANIIRTVATSTNTSEAASLNFKIDGAKLGDIQLPMDTLWHQFYQTFTTPTTMSKDSILIEIINDNTASYGNDFALDDMVFAPVYTIEKKDTISVKACLPAAYDAVVDTCSNTKPTISVTGVDLTKFNNHVTKGESTVQGWYTSEADANSKTSPVTGLQTITSTSKFYARTEDVPDFLGNGVAELSFVVHGLPTVSLTAIPNACVGDAPLKLVGSPVASTNTKGIYKGTGVSGNKFNPSTVTGSPFVIKYIYTDANGCVDSASQNAVVNPIPVAPTVTKPNLVFCVNEAGGDLKTLAGVSGSGTLTWYTDTLVAGSATSPTITTTSATQKEYWVSQTTTNCKSKYAKISVTINALPVATVSGGGLICNDGTTTSNVDVKLTTGLAPFSGELQKNGSKVFDISTVASPFTKAVTDTGAYTVVNLKDANGCVSPTTTGKAQVTYKKDVEATVVTECKKDGHASLADNEFVIKVTVTEGDLSSIAITQTTTIPSVSFTRQGTTNVWLSNAINESNTVGIKVTDVNNCNGGKTFTGLNQRCSCPATATANIASAIICKDKNTSLEVIFGTTGNSTNFDITLTQPDATTQVKMAQTTSPATFTVSQKGTYSVSVKSNGDACTVSGNQVSLDNYLISTATISGTASICDDGVSTTPLTITITPAATSFTVDVLKGGSSYQTGATASINTKDAGTFTLSNLKDANGCAGGVSGTATVSLIAPPVAKITTPSGTSDTSPKLTGVKDGNAIEAAAQTGTGYTYTWSPEATATVGSASSPSTVVNNLTLDVVKKIRLKVEYTTISGVCEASYDDVYFKLVDKTVPDLGPNDQVCVSSLPYEISIPAALITGIETEVLEEDAGVASLDAANRKIIIPTGTAPGSYTIKYTVKNSVNGDSPSSKTVVIDAEASPATVEGGKTTHTYQTCDISQVMNADIPTIGTGVWRKVSGPANLKVGDEAKNNAQIENLGTNTSSVFNWSTSNGTCLAGAPAIVTIEQKGSVTPPVIMVEGMEKENGSIVTVCVDSTINIEGAMPQGVGETGVWSGSAGLTGSTTTQTLYIVSGMDVTVKWSISSSIPGCAEVSREITVKANEKPAQPQFATGNPTEICEGATLPFSLLSPTSEGKYFWSVTDPSLGRATDGSVSNLTAAAQTSVTTGEFGTPIILKVIEKNTCGYSPDNQVEVKVRLTPRDFTGTITAMNSSVCTGKDQTFEVENQGASIKEYKWEVSGLLAKSTTVPSLTLTSAEILNLEGPKDVKVTLKNGCDYGVSKTVSFDFIKAKALSISAMLRIKDSTLSKTDICPEKVYELEINTTNTLVETSKIKIKNTEFPYSLTNTVPFKTEFEGVNLENNYNGKIDITVTPDAAECILGGGKSIPVVFELHNMNKPIIGSQSSVCEDSPLGITMVDNENDNGSTSTVKNWIWYQDGELVGKTEKNNFTITRPDQSGEYTVTVTSKYGCEDQTSNTQPMQIDVKPFLVRGAEKVVVYVNPRDPQPAPVIPIQVTNLTEGEYSVNWTGVPQFGRMEEQEALGYLIPGTIVNPTLGTPNVEETVEYTVEVTNNTCTSDTTITVVFTKPFFPPTAFTPNGDGINDTWVIDGMNNYPRAALKVYNRWGNTVYQKNGVYTGEWSGNGLPAGTYYWTLDFGTKEKNPETGTITIVK